MEWSELDLVKGDWCIPGTEMKMENDHIVPLRTQAIEILPAIQRMNGLGAYVFVGMRDHDRCMSENTINAALRSMGYSKEVMTGHGFRAMENDHARSARRARGPDRAPTGAPSQRSEWTRLQSHFKRDSLQTQSRTGVNILQRDIYAAVAMNSVRVCRKMISCFVAICDFSHEQGDILREKIVLITECPSKELQTVGGALTLPIVELSHQEIQDHTYRSLGRFFIAFASVELNLTLRVGGRGSFRNKLDRFLETAMLIMSIITSASMKSQLGTCGPIGCYKQEISLHMDDGDFFRLHNKQCTFPDIRPRVRLSEGIL
jgi:hypothetical protein